MTTSIMMTTTMTSSKDDFTPCILGLECMHCGANLIYLFPGFEIVDYFRMKHHQSSTHFKLASSIIFRNFLRL